MISPDVSDSSTASPAPASSRGARIATTVVRILMGLAFTLFGAMIVSNQMPQPKTPLAPGAMAFSAALANSGYMMQLIGATQLVVGLLLLSNRFVPLALALLAPFLVNSLAFHLVLEHTGLPMSVVFCAFECFLAWRYRASYRSMLAARATP